MAEEYIFFKVVMLGDSNVGKSTLLSRFTTDEFETESKSTIGIEWLTRYGNIDNKNIKVQFWDTNGRERPLAKHYYNDATVALIVYDITNHTSYKNVEGWLKELREQTTDPNILTVIVGNKSDRGHLRAVSEEEVMSFAVKENVCYGEISTLNENQVREIFMNSIIEAVRRKGHYGIISLNNCIKVNRSG
ncbi:PREDICTED: ras-related protein Rab-11B-like [Camelina sativa]|uniref:Ras-related protein Rab-11B-like n=1 Tax=Camelina sativa TaxID=90675 RepID=A0ABM0WVN3_CAMSA|nr:PREDICTED: ras-related protein Rab-11B-like [Camelina sativa]